MKHIYAVVHKDEDSAYGAHVPDAPGCISAADDLEDLLPNLIEAISLYFEDAPIPAPRSLQEIRRDAAVDIAEGAFLMAVPLMVRANRPTRVNISMDKGMLDAIDGAAALRGMTRSAFLVEAARNEMEGRR